MYPEKKVMQNPFPPSRVAHKKKFYLLMKLFHAEPKFLLELLILSYGPDVCIPLNDFVGQDPALHSCGIL